MRESFDPRCYSWLTRRRDFSQLPGLLLVGHNERVACICDDPRSVTKLSVSSSDGCAGHVTLAGNQKQASGHKPGASSTRIQERLSLQGMLLYGTCNRLSDACVSIVPSQRKRPPQSVILPGISSLCFAIPDRCKALRGASSHSGAVRGRNRR
jgi:hypothetical protein